MFDEVDKNIETDKLISEFRMSALPSLYAQFVELTQYLVIFQNSFMQFCTFSFSFSCLVWLSKSYPVI